MITDSFHEIPDQVLHRALAGREPTWSVEIMDVPTHPVESAEVARTLLDLAMILMPGAGNSPVRGQNDSSTWSGNSLPTTRWV